MNKTKSENYHLTLTFILDFRLAPKSQVWMASHTCKKLFVFISSRVLFQTMFCGDGHLGFHIHKFRLLHSCSLSGPCQTMFFGDGGHFRFQIGTKITSLVEI